MRRGITLIEIIAVLAVTAVVAAIVAPRAGMLLESIHLRGAVAEVVQAFGVARATAVRRAEFSTVKIDAATNRILVRIGPDTVYSTSLGARYGVTVRSNRDSMVFTPLGKGYGAGNQTVIVATRRKADTIVVSRLGRVR